MDANDSQEPVARKHVHRDADIAAFATWERLSRELQRLRSAEPVVLMRYPDPDAGFSRPPVRIDLAADAHSTAADLHETYGDLVVLRVGALPYPPEPRSKTARAWFSIDERDAANPAEINIVLEAPLAIRSGQMSTHGLLLTNLGDEVVRLHTNGHLTATIVDDGGVAVGGYSGAQVLPLVVFAAAPCETVRIPVLVGTASFEPELGYAIPPGTWHLTAPLDLVDGRRLVTPALELTIIS